MVKLITVDTFPVPGMILARYGQLKVHLLYASRGFN